MRSGPSIGALEGEGASESEGHSAPVSPASQRSRLMVIDPKADKIDSHFRISQ